MPMTRLIKKLRVFGPSQQQVVTILDDLLATTRNPSMSTTSLDGVVTVSVNSWFSDLHQTEQKLEATVELVRQRLGAVIFSEGQETLAEAVVGLLRQQGLTLVTAESCTGGWVGKKITDVPGASETYLGGWVTYANAMKVAQLGVPQALIDAHGAVSGEVAKSMAEGALRASGANVSIAITGIAGSGTAEKSAGPGETPWIDGQSIDKPVGTVWIAIGRQGMEEASIPVIRPPQLLAHQPSQNRAWVRQISAGFALQAVRLVVMGQPLDQLSCPEVHSGIVVRGGFRYDDHEEPGILPDG